MTTSNIKNLIKTAYSDYTNYEWMSKISVASNLEVLIWLRLYLLNAIDQKKYSDNERGVSTFLSNDVFCKRCLSRLSVSMTSIANLSKLRDIFYLPEIRNLFIQNGAIPIDGQMGSQLFKHFEKDDSILYDQGRSMLMLAPEDILLINTTNTLLFKIDEPNLYDNTRCSYFLIRKDYVDSICFNSLMSSISLDAKNNGDWKYSELVSLI